MPPNHAGGAARLRERLEELASRPHASPEAAELAELSATLGLIAYALHVRLDLLDLPPDLVEAGRRIRRLERLVVGLSAALVVALGCAGGLLLWHLRGAW